MDLTGAKIFEGFGQGAAAGAQFAGQYALGQQRLEQQKEYNAARLALAEKRNRLFMLAKLAASPDDLTGLPQPQGGAPLAVQAAVSGQPVSETQVNQLIPGAQNMRYRPDPSVLGSGPLAQS